MRPIELKMSGFLSYADETTIDFRGVENKHIFLISGPTGAGKTSIFEGMFFALFGMANGTARKPEDLRSKLIDPRERTVVEFQFKTDKKMFRIRREMYYLIRKGEVVTDELKVDTYLFAKDFGDAAQWTEPGGRVLGQKVSTLTQVNGGGRDAVAMRAYIQSPDVVGMRADQFRKLVMLPQGQYQEFLRSQAQGGDGNTRVDILREVFQTGRFKDYMGKLDSFTLNYRSKRYVELSQLAEQQAYLYFGDKADQSYLDLKDSLNKNIDGLNLFFQTINQAQLSESEQVLFPQIGMDSSEQTVMDVSSRAATWLQEQMKATAEDIKSNTEQKNKENEKQREWTELNGQFDRLTTCRNELEVHNQSKDEFNKKSLELDAATRAAKQILVDAEKNRKEAKEQLNHETTKLGKLRQSLIDIKQKQKFAKIVVDAALDRPYARTKLLQPLDSMKTLLADTQQKCKQINELLKNINRAELKLSEEKKLRIKTSEELETLKDTILQHYLLLAAEQLQEGDPCPVCGSFEHPKKLNKADQDAEKAQKFIELEAKLKQLDVEIQRLKDLLASYRESLIYDIDWSGSHSFADALSDFQNLLQSLNAHNHEPITKALGQLIGGLTDYELKIGGCKQTSEQYQQLSNSQTINAALDEKVFAAAEEIGERLTSILIEGYMTQYDALKSDYDRSAGEIKKYQEDIEQIEASLPEFEARASSTAQVFLDELRNHDFVDEDEYHAAKRSIESIRRLQTYIDEYKNKLQSLNDEIGELEETLKDKTRISDEQFTELNDMIGDLEELITSGIERKALLDEWSSKVATFSAEIQKIYPDYRLALAHLSLLEQLSLLMRGGRAGKKNPTLESYVIKDFMNEIIDESNRHLYDLSNGKFHIFSAEEDHDIELYIRNLFNDTELNTNQPSGGQVFLVSLALALGLSDTIAKQVQVDGADSMLFVDEGFGNLDKSLIQAALNHFAAIQQDHQKKTIAIISHREEMDRIEPKLLVELDESEASSARWSS